MGKPSERIYIIEADPITGEVDRGKVLLLVSDMIGALFAVGGKAYLAADRVEVGTVMVDDKPQSIAETKGIVVRYQSFSPVRRADVPAPPLERHAEPAEDPTPSELEAELEAEADQPADDFTADPERFPEDADLLSDEEIQAELAAEAAAH